MTLACIDSVLKQTSAVRYELIVVDNASTDGSADAIRKRFPEVTLIASPENLGFARANNLAESYGRGRRVLLLNPDTLILDRAIDKLHEFADANPRCRIWGGRTLFADGSLNPQSCWRHMTLWSVFCSAAGFNRLKGSPIFNSEAYGGWKRDTIRAVDIVTGCLFLADRDLWQKLNGLDPIFFMYGEEADLCLRARRMGASPKITPAATIIHYGGASERNKSDQRIMLFASKITLMRRHWSTISYFVGKQLYLLLVLFRWAGSAALGGLLKRRDLQHEARTWRTIWHSRSAWINGWPNAGATDQGAGNSFPVRAQE